MSTKSIDWSKAPEGATRYHPETSKVIEHWLKMVGDEEWIWTSSGKRWMPHIDAVVDGDYHDRPAPEWSGKGLPPVGTVCEWLQGSGHQWERIEILAYHGREAWIQQEGKDSTVVGNIGNLRPLRTLEQIAAEEREKAAKQLCVDAGSPELTAGQMAIAYRLYDTGYRKVDPAGAQP